MSICIRFGCISLKYAFLQKQQTRNLVGFKDIFTKKPKDAGKIQNEFENKEDFAIDDKVTHKPDFMSLADRR